MILTIFFLSTLCNFANAAHIDNAVNIDTEQLPHNSRPAVIAPNIDATTLAVIPAPQGPNLKTKTITAMPFIITAIGACIHIAAILSYGFDEKSRLLVAGDIFWLSSAITGIAVKFSGY